MTRRDIMVRAHEIARTKVQRKFYIAEELADLLRIEAAKRNESQSAIVERALRKELARKGRARNMALTWQVLEDNGGGLHLAVFDGERVIFYGHGYEHNEDGLRADLEALRNGADPRTDAWEMPVDDPQVAYDDLTRHEYGWAVIADQDGVYPERMGAAGRIAFGVEED